MGANCQVCLPPGSASGGHLSVVSDDVLPECRVQRCGHQQVLLLQQVAETRLKIGVAPDAVHRSIRGIVIDGFQQLV